ncbi:hypothetical protein ABT317_47140 [Streptomyces carpinensis]|uniref:Secreted protein n=1 Tax=Streptomyces carpinensis TaxID=66369 RepID=A0ABV1WJG5_9ACTN
MRGPRGQVLLLAVLFALLQLGTVTGRDTPDTKNHLAYALSLSGEGKRETAAVTVDDACAGRTARARRAQSVDVLRFRAPNPAARVTKECRAQPRREVDTRLRAGRTGGPTLPFMSVRFMRIFGCGQPGWPPFRPPATRARLARGSGGTCSPDGVTPGRGPPTRRGYWEYTVNVP